MSVSNHLESLLDDVYELWNTLRKSETDVEIYNDGAGTKISAEYVGSAIILSKTVDGEEVDSSIAYGPDGMRREVDKLLEEDDYPHWDIEIIPEDEEEGSAEDEDEFDINRDAREEEIDVAFQDFIDVLYNCEAFPDELYVKAKEACIFAIVGVLGNKLYRPSEMVTEDGEEFRTDYPYECME